MLVKLLDGPTTSVFFGHPFSLVLPGFWHDPRLYDNSGDADAPNASIARIVCHIILGMNRCLPRGSCASGKVAG